VPFHRLHAVFRILAGAAGAGQRRDGRIAKRQTSNRECTLGPNSGSSLVAGRLILEVRRGNEIDAVRAFGVDALAAAPSPFLVAGTVLMSLGQPFTTL